MPPAESVLADTHTLLWWRAQSERLSPTAEEALAQASIVFVSPLTFWEIAMLVQTGRISLDRPTARWSRDLLTEGLVALAPLDERIAVLAAEVAPLHGDPVDRMLVASARVLGVPLISKDHLIQEYGRLPQGPEVIW